MPSKLITNRFSDVAQDIERVVSKMPDVIAYNLANELQKVTQRLSNSLANSWRLSNSLANSWRYGPITSATGHVFGKGLSEYVGRDENGNIKAQPHTPFEPVERKQYVEKTLKQSFLVWNNSPYLEDRNDGFVFGRYTGANQNFIQQGLSKGHIKAKALLRFM